MVENWWLSWAQGLHLLLVCLLLSSPILVSFELKTKNPKFNDDSQHPSIVLFFAFRINFLCQLMITKCKTKTWLSSLTMLAGSRHCPPRRVMHASMPVIHCINVFFVWISLNNIFFLFYFEILCDWYLSVLLAGDCCGNWDRYNIILPII